MFCQIAFKRANVFIFHIPTEVVLLFCYTDGDFVISFLDVSRFCERSKVVSPPGKPFYSRNFGIETLKRKK